MSKARELLKVRSLHGSKTTLATSERMILQANISVIIAFASVFLASLVKPFIEVFVNSLFALCRAIRAVHTIIYIMDLMTIIYIHHTIANRFSVMI